MQAWQFRDRGHWLALTIGQWDKELPLELLAAVGRTAALDPNRCSYPASGPGSDLPHHLHQPLDPG
ncbi:hypothetical protein [Kitasatospora sp. NPDC001175]